MTNSFFLIILTFSAGRKISVKVILTSASRFLCSLELVRSLFSRLLPRRRDEDPSLETPSFLPLLSLFRPEPSSCLPDPSFLRLPSLRLLSELSRLLKPSLFSSLALAALRFSLAFRVYIIDQILTEQKLTHNS